MYTVSDVHITGPFMVDSLLALQMVEQVNHHAFLTYSGIVAETHVRDTMQNLNRKDAITLYLSDVLVFSGLPLKATLKCENEVYAITVICVSFSYLLDVESRSCSFQDTSLTHTEVLQQLYAKNKTGHILFRQNSNFKTKLPIIQYMETDWEFTLRMAAAANNIVYPHSPNTAPAVFFGVTNSDIPLDDVSNYSESFNTKQYLKQSEQNSKLSLPSYFNVKFEAENKWKLGEQVTVKGQSIVVTEKIIELNNRVVKIKYLLSSVYPCIPTNKTNPHLVGLSLSGEVIEVDGENVKLHLNIDKIQDTKSAFWYSFKPIIGNVFSSMPQCGTTVMLQLGHRANGFGWVTHVVHKNADDVSEMADFNKRYFTTEFKKRLAIIPNLLDFKSKDNCIKLADANGITNTTTANFNMMAGKNILLSSESTVNIATPEKVHITKPGIAGGIDMSGGGIQIKSSETKLISRSKMANNKTRSRTKLPLIEISTGLALKAGATVPAARTPEE